MGITATAVYDIERSGTIVLRNAAHHGGALADALDTLASFSRHCEAQRGIAQSITEVCAQWGGPPYVTYKVVETRFRVIVIWHESPNDAAVDIPYQASHALDRLERAVTSVTGPLLQNDPTAIAKLYEQATYALNPDTPVVLPPTSSQPSQPRLKFSLSLSSSRMSTASSDLKKKQSGFLSKIGAAFKPKEKKHVEVAQVPVGSDSPFRGHDALDDSEGPLALPDSMFTWCASTDIPVVSSSTQDISWFSALIQGGEVPPPVFPVASKSSPSKSPTNSVISDLPALRSGSIPSTPLNIPNVLPASSATSNASGPPLPSPAKPEPPQPVVTPIPPEPSVEPFEHTSKTHSSVDSVTPPSVKKTNLQEGQSSTLGREPTEPASSYVPSGPAGMSTGSTRVPSSGAGASQTPSLQPLRSSQNEGSSILHKELPRESAQAHPTQQAILEQQAEVGNAFGLQQAHIQSHQLQHQYTQQQVAYAMMGPDQAAPTSVQSKANGTPVEPGSQLQDPPTETISTKSPADDFDINELGSYKDTATEVTNLVSGPGPATTDDVNKAADDVIRKRMNDFALTMQSGNFTLALQQVYGTMRILCQLRPRRDREIVTCANYVLAQRILIRNATLESELTRILPALPDAVRRRVECALLTMFLAELKHFLPRHRVAAMRVAVEKNMAVGNFGMCARWLRQLIEKAPPSQKEALVRQLQICASNGESNTHMPPTNRLCYSTLQIVTSPYGKCDVCPAVYHATMSGVVNGQACDTCFVGKVHATT